MFFHEMFSFLTTSTPTVLREFVVALQNLSRLITERTHPLDLRMIFDEKFMKNVKFGAKFDVFHKN